ncbi:hypothetical protein RJ641_000523 [Dillenia turbinata]|uniref:Uncharacterized protein n=1 Tax=Dillenia turbinata TaxID=194707 RepID=A0AAN8W8A0_9MAGN
MYPQVKLLEVITRMRAKLEKLHDEIDKTPVNIINEHNESKRAATTHKQDYEEDELVGILLRIQAKGELEFHLTTNKIKAVILFAVMGTTMCLLSPLAFSILPLQAKHREIIRNFDMNEKLLLMYGIAGGKPKKTLEEDMRENMLSNNIHFGLEKSGREATQ